MGYAFYELADGREAGYGVEAQCDADSCEKEINRGMGYLCGESPKVYSTDDGEWGCGYYFCGEHEYAHDCTNPMCGVDSFDGDLYCGEIRGHEMPHKDPHTGDEFTKTEEDEE